MTLIAAAAFERTLGCTGTITSNTSPTPPTAAMRIPETRPVLRLRERSHTAGWSCQLSRTPSQNTPATSNIRGTTKSSVKMVPCPVVMIFDLGFRGAVHVRPQRPSSSPSLAASGPILRRREWRDEGQPHLSPRLHHIRRRGHRLGHHFLRGTCGIRWRRRVDRDQAVERLASVRCRARDDGRRKRL